jgi:hypothetical protein
VPKRWAAELFESLGDAIEPVEVEGQPAFVVAGDTAAPSDPPRGVRLLPYFDSFVVGGHPRELLFPGRAAERALGGGQAGVYPVLLVGGVVAGVWHQRRTGRKLHISVEPFARLTAAQRRELEHEVAAIGEFLEATPVLTIGPVSARGHL